MTTTSRRAVTLRSLAGAATLALTCTLLPASQAGADDLRDRARDARGQVRGAVEDLQESSKAVTRAQQRLEAAREELGGAQGALASARAELARAQELDVVMADRLRAAEADLAQARRDLEAARAEVRSQRGDIGRLAASMYVNGDPDLMGLSVLLTSQEPAEATSQLATADSLMDRQEVTLEELTAARTAMVDQEARVEAAAQAVAEQRAQAAEQLAQRQQLEAAAQAAAAQVQSLVGARSSARAQASRVRAADRAALAEAERQAVAIRKLILERAARQRGGFSGASDGFLAYPVQASVTSAYGYRVHPIYGYYGLHDGTDFGAACGSANVAVSGGTVISRNYSDVYGNRLYLDVGQVNGKNLTVVYNHLSGYAASEGQRVGRGETVGYTGSTGWSTGCHLHFSVLEDGNPVDPMKYL